MMNLHDYQAQFFDQLTGQTNTEFCRSIQCLNSTNEAEQQIRLAVYQNNYAHSLSEALKDSFPVVLRLIGNDLFTALAIDYVMSTPPNQASLLTYGESFIDFLAGHPQCASLPYLADIARIEWLYVQCFYGPDDKPINMNHLLEVDEELMAQVTFTQHPDCYLLKSDYPVLDIWQANLEDDVQSINLDECEPSQLFMYRDEDLNVITVQLQPLAYEFIQLLFGQYSIESAWQLILRRTNKILEKDELYAMLSYFLQLPAFTNLTVNRG